MPSIVALSLALVIVTLCFGFCIVRLTNQVHDLEHRVYRTQARIDSMKPEGWIAFKDGNE